MTHLLPLAHTRRHLLTAALALATLGGAWAPATAADPVRVKLATSAGDITLELYPD